MNGKKKTLLVLIVFCSFFASAQKFDQLAKTPPKVNMEKSIVLIKIPPHSVKGYQFIKKSG